MIKFIDKHITPRFKSIGKRIHHSLEIKGMIYAAHELHRLGYHKEYEALLDRIREMK